MLTLSNDNRSTDCAGEECIDIANMFCLLNALDDEFKIRLSELSGYSAAELALIKYFDFQQLSWLWQSMIRLGITPKAGLYTGAQINLAMLGLRGALMSTNHSLEHLLESLSLLGQFSWYINSVLIKRSQSVSYQLESRYNKLSHSNFLKVHFLTGVKHILEQESCFQIKPLKVELDFEDNGAGSEYESQFNCPVIFNAPASRIDFSRKLLSLEPLSYDEHLHHSFSAHLSAKSGFSEDTFDVRVSRVIRHLLNDKLPTVEEVSRQFKISPRNLQAKLKLYNVCFKSLVSDVQKEMSRQLLLHSTLSVGEVAFKVGFTRKTSFYRRFQCWFGCTPCEFRGHLKRNI